MTLHGPPAYMESRICRWRSVLPASDPEVRARLLAEESTRQGKFDGYVFNHFAGMFPLLS